MSWKDHVTFNGTKTIYKGIDIGISPEFIQDTMANTVLLNDDEIYKEFERRYQSKISVIRNKKIDDILS